MERAAYQTKQKELLLEFFKNAPHGQFSAKEAFEQINAETGIGKSTVYRLMKNLTEDGVLRRFTGKNTKSVVYQYAGKTDCCKEHFHLKCLGCGKLIHLDCERVAGFEHHIASHHGFSIDHLKTVIYGTCTACGEKKEQYHAHC